MERKEAIRSAYRLTGGNNFYDGMITCSTLSGKAVRSRNSWNREEHGMVCLPESRIRGNRDDFTNDSGRSWAGGPAGSCLRRGHLQRGCWDGASLQLGSAAAVREAWTYNT